MLNTAVSLDLMQKKAEPFIKLAGGNSVFLRVQESLTFVYLEINIL